MLTQSERHNLTTKIWQGSAPIPADPGHPAAKSSRALSRDKPELIENADAMRWLETKGKPGWPPREEYKDVVGILVLNLKIAYLYYSVDANGDVVKVEKLVTIPP